MNPTTHQRLMHADAALRDMAKWPLVSHDDHYRSYSYLETYPTPPEQSTTPVLDGVDWKSVVADQIRITADINGTDMMFAAKILFRIDLGKAAAICRELGLDPDARG